MPKKQIFTYEELYAQVELGITKKISLQHYMRLTKGKRLAFIKSSGIIALFWVKKKR